MAEDWAAVAEAITDRMNELGLLQRDLAYRSRISQAIVRELQRNTVQRRRSLRTLEALSEALEWHPQHLAAVLHEKPRPVTGPAPDPVSDRLDTIEDRLAAITGRLVGIADRLDSIDKRLGDLGGARPR